MRLHVVERSRVAKFSEAALEDRIVEDREDAEVLGLAAAVASSYGTTYLVTSDEGFLGSSERINRWLSRLLAKERSAGRVDLRIVRPSDKRLLKSLRRRAPKSTT